MRSVLERIKLISQGITVLLQLSRQFGTGVEKICLDNSKFQIIEYQNYRKRMKEKVIF